MPQSVRRGGVTPSKAAGREKFKMIFHIDHGHVLPITGLQLDEAIQVAR